MPKNSSVDKMFKAVLKSGQTPESAAKIAQAKTGLALRTGKPPKARQLQKGKGAAAKDQANELETPATAKVPVAKPGFFKGTK